MITGIDNLIYSHDEPVHSLSRFFGTILKRWPNAIIDSGEFRRVVELAHIDLRLDIKCLESGEFSAYITRDSEMSKFADDNGYANMPDRDGPFMVCVERRGATRLTAVVKHDSVDATTYTLSHFCATSIYLYTVVTPALIAEDPFSFWVVDQLCQAICALPYPPYSAEPES